MFAGARFPFVDVTFSPPNLATWTITGLDTNFVDGTQIEFWDDGGPNADPNLATLCWFHHHVAVHRRGMILDPAGPPGRRRLRQPDH